MAADTIRFIVTVAIVVYKGLIPVVGRMLTDKHLLTQIRLLYKCACKDIYVKYLVTYLEGTQQTTINPYELIVIPDGKSNSDYTRNLPSVF